MEKDAEFLLNDAERQLADIEGELHIRPQPSVYSLFEGRFRQIQRVLDGAAECLLNKDLEERITQAKSRLEEAEVTFANYRNEPPSFDVWGESEDYKANDF